MINIENVKNAAILLSALNTALRDEYSSLDDLIYGEDLDFAPIEKTLNDCGCFYDEKKNAFVLRQGV